MGKTRDQIKRKFKVMEKKINNFGFRVGNSDMAWGFLISGI